MELSILPLTEEHLDELAVIYKEVFNAAPWHDKWTDDTARLRIDEIRQTPGFVGYAGFIDGKPAGLLIGYCQTWHSGSTYQIREVAVHDDYRGQGLARQMIQKLEAELVEKGVHQIYVMTRKHGPASRFYEKFGLRVNSQTLVMNKILPRMRHVD